MSVSDLRGKLNIPLLPSKWVFVCQGQDCVNTHGWYKTCTSGVFHTAREFKESNWGWVSNQACLFLLRYRAHARCSSCPAPHAWLMDVRSPALHCAQ
jgi:hypothetical protein